MSETVYVLTPSGVVLATDVPREGTHARKRFEEMLSQGHSIVDKADTVEQVTRHGGTVLVLAGPQAIAADEPEPAPKPRKKVAARQGADDE